MTKTNVATARYSGLTLAVHPCTFGFGWVLFENPQTPVAWAIVRQRAGHERKLLNSFKRLIARYEPATVVLEAFHEGESLRRPRIRRLCNDMLAATRAAKIDTKIFDRDMIRHAFAKFGAQTRGEIARVIAQRIDSFGHRLPTSREVWITLDPRQCLFDAAAVALTYFVQMGELDPWT